jgi:hypothetical protein
MRLFNAGKITGLKDISKYPASIDEWQARKYLEDHPKFIGYIDGRVMSMEFSKDHINPIVYDDHNGVIGKAAELIEDLRIDLANDSKWVTPDR